MHPRKTCLWLTTAPRAQRGRAWARILVGAAVAFLLVFVGAFVALSLVDWNKHVAAVAAKVKAETGRELKVRGKVEVGLLPLRVIAEEVSFGNAPWGSRPEMVTAKRVELRIALAALVTGDVKLRVDLVEPDVLIERSARGDGNWEFPPAPRSTGKPERGTGEPPVSFDWLRIRKGAVTYRDGRTGKSRRLLVDEGLARPKGLSGQEITLKATVDGVPVEVHALTGEPPVAALARGAPLGIKVEATTTGARVAAEGRIAFPATGPAVDLKVSADAADMRPLAKLAGTRLPALPPLALAARLTSAKQVYTVEELRLAAGKSTASGHLTADLSGARPKIAGELAAPLLDVAELTGQRQVKSSGAAGNGSSDRVFSKEPLPLGALNAVDGEIAVKVARLVATRDLLLEEVHGRVALSRGRLDARPLAMRMGGGEVKLAGTVDASGGSSAQFKASLSGSGIDLGRMMAALGRPDDVQGGQTELAAELRSSGGSMAALAGALDGHARAIVRSARVKGGTFDRLGGDVFVQLINAVNPARKAEPYADVQCAVVNVPVRNGVVVVDRTVAVETAKVGTAVAGTVDLRTERLDLSVRPQAKQGLGVGIGSLASLVKIEGTLANPTVGVDVKGAAGAAAQVGLGVITGGLSILAKGLFDKATMDAPCQTALRNGNASASAADKPSQKAEPPTSGKPPGFFERLFK